LLALIVYAVGDGSIEIFSYEGLEFFTSTDWNAVYGRDAFGALPYIIGTLVTSTIAMAIGVPISLGIAVFLSDISPARLSTPLSFVIELLAAVPSIVYGLWALFVFRFWIIDLIERPLYNAFGGSIPFFAKTPFGLDVFTAGIVLAIMIIPIISSWCYTLGNIKNSSISICQVWFVRGCISWPWKSSRRNNIGNYDYRKCRRDKCYSYFSFFSKPDIIERNCQ
jgi:ABC-type phosphate transport system permease subunit